MFKFLSITFSALVIFCMTSQSADAQLFRNRGIFQSNTFVSPRPAATYTPSYSRPAKARPVTGYGANFHRNFVIRQEQQRTAITGLPPRSRGNVLWAR